MRISKRPRTRTILLAASAVSALAAGTAVAVSQSAVAAPAATSAAQAPLTKAQAAQLSQHVNTPVIVVLKYQPGQAEVGSGAQADRTSAVAFSQAALMSELTEVHATHVKRYQLVNALAATVSAGE